MALWAEWDPETSNVIQTKNDEDNPGTGALVGGFTGAERATGSETKWYPLVVEYPENYSARFPQLLGPAKMTLEDDGKVHQTFVKPNFTEDAVRQALRDEVDRKVWGVLTTTDWVFTREREEGTPVPDDVRTHRVRVKARGKLLKSQIGDAAAGDLLDFDTTVVVPDGEASVGGLS